MVSNDVEGSSYVLISGTTVAFVEGTRKPRKGSGWITGLWANILHECRSSKILCRIAVH